MTRNALPGGGQWGAREPLYTASNRHRLALCFGPYEPIIAAIAVIGEE